MEELRELVKTGKTGETAERVKLLLGKGAEPNAIMKSALIPAMDDVGELFQQGRYFLPELLVSAKAMKLGLEILKPHLVASGSKPLGKVILGTVKGDLHDLGKNILTMALEGAGFEVVDLGTDISPASFIKAIREHEPKVVGMSALLTTTMYNMKATIEEIKKAGLRNRVKIMIGGAPVTQKFADEIGADFYGHDATSGKNFARNAVSGEA